MSAQASLDFSKGAPLCKCGHEVNAHARGKGLCMTCGAECRRYRSKKRVKVELPPGLAAPAGALELVRPDTKRRKAMGWALVMASKVTIFLDGLKTKSPNETRHVMHSDVGPRAKWMFAAIANALKAQRERAMSAVEQCRILDRGRPSKVVICRISSRALADDDNLVGAGKAVRDGIAEALLVDDKHFSIGGQVEGAIPIFYVQAAPGRRGVRGVRIDLEWRNGEEP